MTLTVQHTAQEFRCDKCHRGLGHLHDGVLYVKVGKTTVVTCSGSVICPNCSFWNHLSVKDEAVVK